MKARRLPGPRTSFDEDIRGAALAMQADTAATLLAIQDFQAELAALPPSINALFELCRRSESLWALLQVHGTAVQNHDDQVRIWVTGSEPSPGDNTRQITQHLVTDQTSTLPSFSLLVVVPDEPRSETPAVIRVGRDLTLGFLKDFAIRYGETRARIGRQTALAAMARIEAQVTAPDPADVVALGASVLKLQREKRVLFDEYVSSIVAGWSVEGVSVHSLSFNGQYLLAEAGKPSDVLPYDVDRSLPVHEFVERAESVSTGDGLVVTGFPFDFRHHQNWGLLTVTSAFKLSKADAMQFEGIARAIGNMIESAASARQRTVLNRRNRRLDDQVEERTALLEAEQQKLQDLLGAMSHETRSPLASITGTLELWGQEELSDQQREWHSSMSRAADRLLRTSQRLLRFVDADPDKVAARLSAGTVRALLFGAEERWRELLIRTGHLLATSVGDAAEFPVGRSPDLDLVLDELLMNVAQHANAGAVSLTAEMTGDGTVIIDLEDPGPGFERRHPASPTPAPFGVGDDHGAQLGLLIVERIVDALGGTVEVGRPTTSAVRITLPAATVNDYALLDER